MVKTWPVTDDERRRSTRALTIALFEDVMDACDAVVALAKAGFGPDQLSIVARDLEADQGDQADRHVTLAQALVGTGLTPIADHLAALILTIVPERGAFLMAGDPTHVMLDLGQREPAGDGEPGELLQQLLIELGFSAEEAGFLDARLTNGSILVGAAGDDAAALNQARELLSERDAIHLGQGDAVLPPLEECLHAVLSPDAGLNGDVVVSDALARFIPLSLRGDAGGPWRAVCGATLTDASGNELGEIVEVLVEPTDGFELSAGYEPRYAVLKHGGVLGLMQRLTVLPVELIGLDEPTGAVRTTIDYDVIGNAAAYDPNLPLSRREEETICAYFGVIPRWT